MIFGPRHTPDTFICGIRNPDGVDSVNVNEDVQKQAKFGEFPWVIIILSLEPWNYVDINYKVSVYLAGGSLIHPSVVLTTAYSVANIGILKVRAGEWDSRNNEEPYPHQDRDVAHVVVHEQFNSGNLHNDIALLFLTEPVIKAPNVELICLPPPRMETPPATHCFAAGWGKNTFEKTGEFSSILKKIKVPIVDDATCVNKLRDQTRLGKYFELHSSFMCAGGELDQDTCEGDGGSPLACQFTPDRYMQIGIVSWGIGCGEDGIPGVYTDVAHLRNWIDDKVREKGFDTSVYTI